MPFFKSFTFIAMLAALMGISALGIDAVLPAFPNISQAFSLVGAKQNSIQQVVYTFMLGLAIMQLIFGIMSDIFGRKIMLISGLIIYVFASLAVLFINRYDYLLFARFVQGVGLAAPRVLSLAIVRDVSKGREMSRIMSFVMMVFLLVPILAPTIGQFAISLGDWHNIFYLFVLLGCALILWISLQLPETLPKEKREKPEFQQIFTAFLTSFTHRPTLVYLIIMSALFSMMMIYIGQAEQIYGSTVYQLGNKFPLAFAATALGMVAASLLNSSIVMKFGMRAIVRRALHAMLLIDGVLLACTIFHHGLPPLWLFMPFLILHLFCFGLSMPNLNTLILEPHGDIAGTVSAVVGTVMTVIGVVIGQIIAKTFAGNVYPLVVGFTALSVLATIGYSYVQRLPDFAEQH